MQKFQRGDQISGGTDARVIPGIGQAPGVELFAQAVFAAGKVLEHVGRALLAVYDHRFEQFGEVAVANANIVQILKAASLVFQNAHNRHCRGYFNHRCRSKSRLRVAFKEVFTTVSVFDEDKPVNLVGEFFVEAGIIADLRDHRWCLFHRQAGCRFGGHGARWSKLRGWGGAWKRLSSRRNRLAGGEQKESAS